MIRLHFAPRRRDVIKSMLPCDVCCMRSCALTGSEDSTVALAL